MSTLQVRIDDTLAAAIKKSADHYKVPASALVKIVLAEKFLHGDKKAYPAGNIFNADRDNKGKGIPVDDFLKLL